ncbi:MULTISPECIES: membrane or secreted protein [Flavobacteriaceae]|uniref:membrane or secreted protein n=1 Tax=Flavobacteriaceae TaxID=49546 RepID=UPI0014928F84|nr:MULTISPECIES: membrane or secreted protein [Allomuricauda]MDC6365312.1 membrane or secreted protein [Muricauda sp. AC10]
MKKVLLTIILCQSLLVLKAQNFEGAWASTSTNAKGVEVSHVAIISGDYFSEAFYDKKTGKFIGTWGGTFTTTENTFTYTFEYVSFDPELVGTSNSIAYQFLDGKILMDDKIWAKIDNGNPGELNGAWLISGRMRNGEIRKRDTSGPRKTMKILSGTRFQWIAYNTETKEFMGTGGGTYTTVNGKYTEHIEFFSRDDSRVGASLQFDFELKDGDWHHSGLSSKGQPIYEIWSKRSSLKN